MSEIRTYTEAELEPVTCPECGEGNVYDGSQKHGCRTCGRWLAAMLIAKEQELVKRDKFQTELALMHRTQDRVLAAFSADQGGPMPVHFHAGLWWAIESDVQEVGRAMTDNEADKLFGEESEAAKVAETWGRVANVLDAIF